jgi:formiminotetrahydrofolate cyclodeaminase
MGLHMNVFINVSFISDSVSAKQLTQELKSLSLKEQVGKNIKSDFEE